MSKSVTGTLVGIAADRGWLKLSSNPRFDPWKRDADPRKDITIKNLLRMSSGLHFDETYGLFGDAPYMLFTAPSTARYALDKPLQHPPGKHWKYSSGTTNILSFYLKKVMGVQRYYKFPREGLFEPIGMKSAVMEPDPSGTFVGSSFMYATARDWARFGLLYLRNGIWNGNRVLPEGWVEFATSRAPAAPEGRYGAHWWLNKGEKGKPSNRPFPELPADLYRASGFEGQELIVVPSENLVVVRLGMTPDRKDFKLPELVKPILQTL
jgi:CubicO group peptidase (beta-lactamase class C family)